MSSPPVNETPRVRPFLDWLREQSQGKTADELSEGLHTLIDKVRETEKKGSITLKVTVAHDQPARARPPGHHLVPRPRRQPHPQ